MHFDPNVDPDRIAQCFRPASGGGDDTPDASIVIPVNAQGDLENVCRILGDLARYAGPHRLEALLVLNNFEGAGPTREIERFEAWGVRVLAVPDVRRHGEAVALSARMHGVRAAGCETVLLFDADCRIPDATALIDWYVERFRRGAGCAYTHVAHYDYEPHWDLRIHFALHHLARWVKRVPLRIPTTRGSNYAVRRTPMIGLYEAGLLADEMNVGPAFSRSGQRVDYSGARRLRVYTSGRMFRRGLLRRLPYYRYRLLYNLRVLPGGAGVRARSGRENDPVRRYQDNRPIR